jgi:N-acetylglucosaminyldiphosphoundecaprenol N-acetyl-beta-D-mannosaminyltransferase
MFKTRSKETENALMENLIKKQNVLDVGYNFISYYDLFHLCQYWRENEESHYVTFAPPYSIKLCRLDPLMRKATNQASLTMPDGIGNILAANMLGYSHKGRVTGPSTILKICDWGREKGLRHFFYGGDEGVADKLVENLCQKYPGLEVVGTFCPPFRRHTEKEDKDVISMINSAEPDIVWIGLGAPKQEKWMHNHSECFDSAILMGVGATFNFISGNVKWAPAWIRKMGLEWVYRAIQEPMHYTPRILFYPKYLMRVLGQRLRKLDIFS